MMRPPCIVITCIYNEAAPYGPLRPPKNPGRTVPTILLSTQRLAIAKLWIAFGTGKNFRFLAAHETAGSLGPDRCIALPMFHAFAGRDTVSVFRGRGKTTACQHGTQGMRIKKLQRHSVLW
jgi:hypothetical protein